MNQEIINNYDEKIDYIFHSGSENNQHLLIIGHGVTGDMDQPLILKLSEEVAKQGMAVLRFSFSGNGNSEGRFEHSTISKEIQDLQSILSAVIERGWRPIYAGHGMGGAVGALTAAVDSRIELLISLAGIVEIEEFCNSEFGMITPGKGNMWNIINCPLSHEFVKEMRQIKSVLPRASSIQIPWLLIHGANDGVVPIADSQSLMSNYNKTREFVEINGADHLFSGETIESLTDSVIDWLGRKLQS
jgi:alpha/beta superfamily hydrolase